MADRLVEKFEYNNIEIMARLSAVMGVTKDIDLAKAIGETQSKVASWKRVKSPPAVSCFEVAMHTGTSIEWLLLGTESVFNSNGNAVQSALSAPVDQSAKSRFSTLFFDAIKNALETETLFKGNDVSDAEIKRLGLMLFLEVNQSSNTNSITKTSFAEQFLTLLKKALHAGTFKLGEDVSDAELKRHGIMLYNSLNTTNTTTEQSEIEQV